MDSTQAGKLEPSGGPGSYATRGCVVVPHVRHRGPSAAEGAVGAEARLLDSLPPAPEAGAPAPGATIVLVEPDAAARREIGARLERSGDGVAAFSDPHDALLFLLGHLDEVCAVLVPDESEDTRISRLRRRLEALPAAPALRVYGRDPIERRPRAARRGRGLR